jgi:pimeloyl-ACP methyl ester carboxylesterase
MPRPSVLLIHGIASDGAWHDTVADALEPHFRCVFVKYPHYLRLGWLKVPSLSWLLALPIAAALLAEAAGSRLGLYGWPALLAMLLAVGAWEWLRRRAALNLLRRRYDAIERRAGAPHVIAHSFGTYLAGRLLRLPYVRYGRVVFVGAPLPRRFWVGRLDSERLTAVRNEVGRQDLVVFLVGLVSRFMPGFGAAGWSGFGEPAERVHSPAGDVEQCETCACGPAPGPLVHNARVGEFTHSDAFIGTGYAERFWLPFLWDVPGAELVEFHAACARAVTLEEEENWPELERHERDLRRRVWRLWGGLSSVPMSLEDYVRHYVDCRARATGQELEAETLARLTDRAVRLTWWASTDARAERRKPRGEREEAVLLALKPVQAVRRAVNAVFPPAASAP